MKPLFLTIYLVIIMFFLYNSAFSQGSKLSYCDSAGTMPSFRFYSPSGALFCPDSLNKKNTTVLIYFKTSCPYCAEEADMISKNIHDFPSVDFIFLTREKDTASIRNFAVTHKLENIQRVKFLQDKEKLYYTYYKANYIPSTHVYDKNNKLKLFTENVLSREELSIYVND